MNTPEQYDYGREAVELALRFKLEGGAVIEDMPKSTRWKFEKRWEPFIARNGRLFLGDGGPEVVPADEIEAKLQQIYDSAQFGRDKLYQTFIHGKYLGISRAAVAAFLAKQPAQQLHRVVPKRFNHVKSVTADEPLERWEIDATLLSETPLQRRYMVVAMDVHSKYCHAKLFDKNKRAKINAGLKGVSGRDVANWLRTIWTEAYHPRYLQSDNGVEFKNADVADVCREFGVRQIFGSVYASRSQGQAERLNRTLKSMIFRRFTHEDDRTFNNQELQAIVRLYNDSWHSTTQKVPREAHKFAAGPNPRGVTKVANNIKRMAQKIHDKHRNTQPPLQVGDRVRIALNVLDPSRVKKEEKKFAKGYVQQWSEQIYQVHFAAREKATEVAGVKSFSTPFYLLRGPGADPAKHFYRWQLQFIERPNNLR